MREKPEQRKAPSRAARALSFAVGAHGALFGGAAATTEMRHRRDEAAVQAAEERVQRVERERLEGIARRRAALLREAEEEGDDYSDGYFVTMATALDDEEHRTPTNGHEAFVEVERMAEIFRAHLGHQDASNEEVRAALREAMQGYAYATMPDVPEAGNVNVMLRDRVGECGKIALLLAMVVQHSGAIDMERVRLGRYQDHLALLLTDPTHPGGYVDVQTGRPVDRRVTLSTVRSLPGLYARAWGCESLAFGRGDVRSARRGKRSVCAECYSSSFTSSARIV